MLDPVLELGVLLEPVLGLLLLLASVLAVGRGREERRVCLKHRFMVWHRGISR